MIFLPPLLGSWNKGSSLLETLDMNKEKIGDKLVLQNYRQFKLFNE